MLDIVFSYRWEPVPIHRIRMNTRKEYKWDELDLTLPRGEDPVPTFNWVFQYQPIASEYKHSRVATKCKI